MRRSVYVLAVMLAFVIAGPALAYDCSCTAPDRSCSASVSCLEGCYAICGSGGQCSSGCSGGGPGGGGPRHDTPLVAMPAPATNLVSLSAADLEAQGIADLLRDALGSDVRFLPVDPLQTYSIHVTNFPPDELARALAKYGVVAVAGETKGEALAAGAAPEAEVTIRLEEGTMGQVVGLLGQLVAESGVILRVTDPEQAFSLDVQRMPLGELLAALEKMGAIAREYETR